MTPLPALLFAALQGPAAVSASFPELAVRELAALRSGVAAAAWLAAHPGDDITSFRRDAIREGDERWCARASRIDHLPGGARVVRSAYFYPPAPPPSLALPTTEGPTLIREGCVLGTIWLETPSADSTAGSTLAERTRDALTRAYGAVTPSPDAWFGRTPTMNSTHVAPRSSLDSSTPRVSGVRRSVKRCGRTSPSLADDGSRAGGVPWVAHPMRGE